MLPMSGEKNVDLPLNCKLASCIEKRRLTGSDFMRALIVDDDELSLEILQDVLVQLGYEVERAHNGREALSRLRRHSIHLVVTCCWVPMAPRPSKRARMTATPSAAPC